MLINPGSGDKTPDNDWSSLPNLSLAKNVTTRTSAWQDLMETNDKGMEGWDSWKNLYIDTFGFENNLDDTTKSDDEINNEALRLLKYEVLGFNLIKEKLKAH